MQLPLWGLVLGWLVVSVYLRSLKLIALGGEVVADYSLRLKGQYGWDNTWVAGYSNDVFGYTPSARILREGRGRQWDGACVDAFLRSIAARLTEPHLRVLPAVEKDGAQVDAASA